MSRRAAGRFAAVGPLLVVVTLGTVTLGSGAQASTGAATDFRGKATSWDAAAARLGTTGSLWEPMDVLGLERRGRIEVLADNLAFGPTGVLRGDTFAGASYGTGRRTVAVAEKWAATGWAAEPAFTTSRALVHVVRLPLGTPGTRNVVRAHVFANCYPQPADADPRPVPNRYRCAKSDVLKTGGVVVLTARPPSQMTAPGATSIVLTSEGITYAELMLVARSLQQVAGSTAEGAGSAQMRAMCEQMVSAVMTAEQAQAFALSLGYTTRVGTIDGVPQAVTMDYRPDRFTLSVTNLQVVGCAYG
jgi:hypothetical protein